MFKHTFLSFFLTLSSLCASEFYPYNIEDIPQKRLIFGSGWDVTKKHPHSSHLPAFDDITVDIDSEIQPNLTKDIGHPNLFDHPLLKHTFDEIIFEKTPPFEACRLDWLTGKGQRTHYLQNYSSEERIQYFKDEYYVPLNKILKPQRILIIESPWMNMNFFWKIFSKQVLLSTPQHNTKEIIFEYYNDVLTQSGFSDITFKLNIDSSCGTKLMYLVVTAAKPKILSKL